MGAGVSASSGEPMGLDGLRSRAERTSCIRDLRMRRLCPDRSPCPWNDRTDGWATAARRLAAL